VVKKILLFAAFISIFVVFALPPITTRNVVQSPHAPKTATLQHNTPQDTTLHFPVNNLVKDDTSDLLKKYPVDLKTPQNIQTSVVYDPVSAQYYVYTKLGNMDLTSPIVMDSTQYQRFSMQQSMQSYWRQLDDSVKQSEDQKFAKTDTKFSLGPADKLFGKGGVQLHMQGSAEVGFGIRTNSVDNPVYTPSMRNPPPAFNFTEKIQANVNGKVGNKINFNLNYNTESTFDYDQKMVKLNYQGDNDEFIRKIEAGNVSMPLNSSLISGSSSLFGIKAEMQFGKLNVVAIASQQQSQTQTVNTQGGVQTTKFQFPIDQYDANRHFFLSSYFRNHFEQWMNQLPYVTSGITINRVEVWVTNKRGDFSQARNILAFADLGESSNLTNSHWTLNPMLANPDNTTNSLYKEISSLSGVRNIQSSIPLLNAQFGGFGISGSHDFELVESARRLDPSEYTLNSSLGYITLRSKLNTDDVLAIAYEYTEAGKTYQVGEFSTDPIAAPQALIVKLIKNTNLSPSTPLWKLMMKNIYYVGSQQIQADKFQLNILYQNDSTGTAVNYINEGNIKNIRLLQVMNLDRLDAKNEPHPDGIFDYIEGYTVVSNGGYIIFPENEPFGSYLASKIGNPTIAQKYVFQQLYDSTLTVAQQYSQKNKFILSGQYKGTSSSQIQLNAMNIPRGSVVVTAGGQTLVENQDYVVDYTMGTVTILNQGLLSSGTNISVKLENQSMFNLQRKTLFGTHLEYAFSKDFTLGGTIMNLSEMPLTQNVNYGSDPISNTIWGLNTSYRTESQWLTNLADKIPLLNLTKPSTINFNAEFAQLIPGHSSSVSKQGIVYIDDFESTQTDIDLSYPYNWSLASTPYDDTSTPLFREAGLSNNLDYGKNRALFNWFTIDQSVFSTNSSLTPAYIRNNKNLQSNNLTRPVLEQEIFPNKQSLYGTTSYLPVLNLSYFPTERGPYNVDALPGAYSAGLDANGNLRDPQSRWGGIMRALPTTDFAAANIEYIDFWMMDPFVNDSLNVNPGGDLYFDLGDISEDVLKAGYKFFENGLPANGDTTGTIATVWGRVPTIQSTVLAFDNSQDALKNQDVGLDGLSKAEEYNFPTYQTYLAQLKTILSPATIRQWQNNPYSPFNDPAGDSFASYRSPYFDNIQADILQRYKQFNGTKGNSTNDPTTNISTAATSLPDTYDINHDNTLNQSENYYQYKVSLRRPDLQVGQDFLVDKIVSKVDLKNGKQSNVTWYHFQIPIQNYQKRIGNITDFSSIRFMRMFMTDFQDSTFLRFGTLNLVRGEWRTYTQPLNNLQQPPSTNGQLTVGAVNIESDGNRIPVNYVMPPGVTRQVDPSQPQIVQENEQSLAMTATNLSQGDARAVYKNTSYDMRKYKRIQMFTHAEALPDNATNLQDYDMTAFVRIGSDMTNNYYEYEIPLKVTPPGHYQQNNPTDVAMVWPQENNFNIDLSVLTNLKLQRNSEQGRNGSVSYSQPYSYYDPNFPKNKVTVIGNPSLSDVETIMIGVRNNGRTVKSGNIWFDEFRLTDFNESGGWAGVANLAIGLSDFGTINLAGKVVTAGFGGIEQSLMERSMNNDYQYNAAAMLQLGKFFPEKAHVSIPLYMSMSQELTQPKYNPLDQDILLSDALSNATTVAQQDSIKALSQTWQTTKSFNITNAKIDIRSKEPKLYDPANFSFSYLYNETSEKDPTTIYNFTKNYQGSFNYTFSTAPKPWEPFKKSKALRSPFLKWLAEFNLNFTPSLIAYNANITRSYTQSQLRDFDAINSGITQSNYDLLSFSDAFLLNKRLDFRYDITKGLSLSFSSTTNSSIDEPYVPVDKNLFPDEFKVWKDSIQKSLMNLGRPLAYQQLFNVSYTLPFNKFPYLDFINGQLQYNSNYNWQTGVTTSQNLNVGNVISSTTQTQANGQFNFEMLYNKITYLRTINQKFGTNAMKMPFVRRTFKQKIVLKDNQPIKIIHHLNSQKLMVSAIDSIGKPIAITYKRLDANTLEIAPLFKSKTATISITTLDPNEMTLFQHIAEYASRILMMARRGSVTYHYSQNMTLPGFVGTSKWFGQSSVLGSTAPGLDFAFGFFDKNFLNKAYNKGWLLSNDTVVNPATFSTTKDFDARLNLEPLPGLKINLGQQWSSAGQSQTQYMFKGMPTTFNGTLQMSYIAIKTAFQSSGNVGNGYASKAYEQFKQNQATVAAMLANRYAGQQYPTTGFMQGAALAGKTYDSNNGGINPNSPDVLIPAFLAAYSGHSVNSGKLGLFPSLLQSLPNWQLSYDGLSNLPFIAKYLRSLTINHTYTCQYTIGSYSSYSNWAQNANGLGFIQDVVSGNPVPSSPYNISTVMLTENFSPLIGFDATLKNSMTAHLEYRTQRNLALNMTSDQIMEASTKAWVIGIGYMLKNFNVILNMKKKQSKVQNDLNLRCDVSIQNTKSLLRTIDTDNTQPIDGGLLTSIKVSADYVLSSSLNVRAFYDRTMSNPLISNSYSMANSDFGVSFRFMLSR
jgi:cell surface protein SprA